MSDRICNIHGTKVFHTLEALLAANVAPPSSGSKWERDHIERRRIYWTRRWKQHKLRHPSKPWVQPCHVCSGGELRDDIRHGRWKVSTRNEQRELRELTTGL